MLVASYPAPKQKTIDGPYSPCKSRAMRPNIFLEGNFAPINAELTLAHSDLAIVGKIPRDLHGAYYRTGPNPAQPVDANYHWFFGDGMVHAFHFNHGAVSYQNAWVRTPTFALEQKAGRSLFLGNKIALWANLQLLGGELLSLIAGFVRHGNADTYTKLISKANTAILPFRDQLYALVESSPPLRLSSAQLATQGFEDFGTDFSAPFTAHPKLDFKTGYLYGIGYRVAGRPRLEYYVINPSGKLVSRTPIEMPYSAMVHDFAITENYALIPVFPAVASLAALRRGRVAEWHGDKPALLYVLRRDGDKNSIRTLELPTGYAYHYANAYEEAGMIMLDAFFYNKVPLMGSDQEIREELFAGKIPGALTRFHIDLAAKKVSAEKLWHEGFAEFPVIDHRLVGSKYETLYAALRRGECTHTEGIFDSQVAFHLHKGRLRAEVTPLPLGHFGGEPVFVPTGKPGQSKGYLLNIIYDSNSNHSYLGIFDAAKPERRALCEVHLPHRVPYGFHGAWRSGRA